MPFEILGTVREFSGGAACNDLLLKKARGAKLPIYICYGMTETAGMITILDKEDFANGVEGVGQNYPMFRCV